MHERPPKLSFSATRVLKASRVLAWGAKAVWLEDHALDQGPEGAWISAANLGARLGLAKESVERHRRSLLKLGLYHVVRRPGARADGWVPTLPAICIPPLRPTVDHIMTGAAHLDQWLGVPNGVTADAMHGVMDDATMAQSVTPLAPEARRAEGGRGEGRAPTFRGRETTLQPLEDGEVARATEAEDGAEDGGETLAERRARFRKLLK